MAEAAEVTVVGMAKTTVSGGLPTLHILPVEVKREHSCIKNEAMSNQARDERYGRSSKVSETRDPVRRKLALQRELNVKIKSSR
jgi:hypothetical protein